MFNRKYIPITLLSICLTYSVVLSVYQSIDNFKLVNLYHDNDYGNFNLDLKEANTSTTTYLSRYPRHYLLNNVTSLSDHQVLASRFESFYKIHVTGIYVGRGEFPLSKLMFKLTLQLALDAVNKNLEQRKVRLTLNVRSANTCSRQFAGAVAAEEYYTERARLFIVSGCDAAIRTVSGLASDWRVPVLTAAGFGADLNDKSIHKNLIRIAFSLQSAVEFLVRVLKLFQWQRVNLIVDESDPNSLALKQSIERFIIECKRDEEQRQQPGTGGDSASSVGSLCNITLNTILLDLQSLTNYSSEDDESTFTGALNLVEINATKISATTDEIAAADRWPNVIADSAIQNSLRQSSLFSRVNILLIPQNYLRKFMLSVYDQGMANGFYTFISIPLLLLANDDQLDNSAAAGSANYSKQSYTTSTGKNVFSWRQKGSLRNSQAKLAYESLMSIYLRNPVSKAYVYFASKLTNFANSDYATTTTTTTPSSVTQKRLESDDSTKLSSSKIQLNIDPYSASFYDCLLVYGIVLEELLVAIEREGNEDKRRNLKRSFHNDVSNQLRNRRFDNMVTGTILINQNGDRDTEYTLDDLNQMNGKFAPVILYKSENKQLERLGRIQWSSDETVGPTIDNVDCNLNGTCQSKPISRFLVTFTLLATPLGLVMGTILYFVYKNLRLESQLVDYWWKINSQDIELVDVRRKDGGSTSSVLLGSGSHVSSEAHHRTGKSVVTDGNQSRIGTRVTTMTRTTNTSGFNSSAADICYGNISLGNYKLNKVAIKPIAKLKQSRKLMIELRTIKRLNHANLCRFIGIIVEEPHTAIVTEFCSKGSLREFFQNESMVIDLTFKYSIINDIIAGLLYLHSSPIGFHGRLKAGNCLISSRFVVKLSDYGLLSMRELLDELEETDVLLQKRVCLAPEQLKNPTEIGNQAGDVYSFGLLLYEVITNQIPFYNKDKTDFIMPLNQLIDKLKSNGPSAELGIDTSNIGVSQSNIQILIDLMEQCIRYDSKKRPSSTSVASAVKGITRGITSKKLLENLTVRMEQYTNNLESLVDAKLATLIEEKQKTEELLYQFVPKSIASLLKEGQSIEPEAFDCVTVFYSDIVGFTSLSSESSPMEVIDFLSDLYLCFDETLEQYDIYKVDTIGDAYIVASGLPQRNDGRHVIEIARAALDLRDRLARFKIPHKPGRSLEMRVGIHSGPCIAGIVGGINMPKYCVFGDTVTIGKFMESSGLPMKIHITKESKDLLDAIAVNEFKIEPRAPKVNRDGIPYQTYWLENAHGP